MELEKIITWNTETTAGFTGHRPDKLDNAYSFQHPTAIKVKNALTLIVEDLIINQGIDTFITGGAIGTDQIAFWTVEALKKKYPHIKNIIAVPFREQPIMWKNKKTLEWYDKMIKRADLVIYVDETEGKYIRDNHRTPVKKYSEFKMQIRNEFMVDFSKILVSVWNGEKNKKGSGTYNCITYAYERGRTIHQINPKEDFKIKRDITKVV